MTPALADVAGRMMQNQVDIIANGATISSAGQNYTLESGNEVPSSITFTDSSGGGTVYLPVRRVSQILGVEIGWDGARNAVVIGGGTESEEQGQGEIPNVTVPNTYLDWSTVPDFGALYPDATLQYKKDAQDGSSSVYVYQGTDGAVHAMAYWDELESSGFQAVGQFEFDRGEGVVREVVIHQFQNNSVYVSCGYTPDSTYSVMVSNHPVNADSFFYLDGEETQSTSGAVSGNGIDKDCLFRFTRNYVDGIDITWMSNNLTGRTINYYTLNFAMYNPVGDPAYDKITGDYRFSVKMAGPATPGDYMACGGVHAYSSACSELVIETIEVEYDDGTIEVIPYYVSTSND